MAGGKAFRNVQLTSASSDLECVPTLFDLVRPPPPHPLSGLMMDGSHTNETLNLHTEWIDAERINGYFEKVSG
jgi:hypothetical protein